MKRYSCLVALLICVMITINACGADSSGQCAMEPNDELVYSMTYELYNDSLLFGVLLPVDCAQVTHTRIRSSANEAIQIGNLQITVGADLRVVVYDYGVGVTLFPVTVINTGDADTYLSSAEFSRLNSNCGYPVAIDYVYIENERTPISALPPLSSDERIYFCLPIEAFTCENIAWYRPFAISERITDYANDRTTVIHYVFKICLMDECQSGTCW